MSIRELLKGNGKMALRIRNVLVSGEEPQEVLHNSGLMPKILTANSNTSGVYVWKGDLRLQLEIPLPRGQRSPNKTCIYVAP